MSHTNQTYPASAAASRIPTAPSAATATATLTPRKRARDETRDETAGFSGDAIIAKAREIAALATAGNSRRRSSSSSHKKPRSSTATATIGARTRSGSTYAVQHSGVGVRNTILRQVLEHQANHAGPTTTTTTTTTTASAITAHPVTGSGTTGESLSNPSGESWTEHNSTTTIATGTSNHTAAAYASSKTKKQRRKKNTATNLTTCTTEQPTLQSNLWTEATSAEEDNVDTDPTERPSEALLKVAPVPAPTRSTSPTATVSPPPAPTTTTMDHAMGDIETVDGVFRSAAQWVTLVWMLLVAGTLVAAGQGHARFLPADEDRAERAVPRTSFFILLVSFLSQMTPLLLARMRSSLLTSSSDLLGSPSTTSSTSDPGTPTTRHTTESDSEDDHHDSSASSASSATSTSSSNPVSGILVAAFCIQGISLATNGLLGWGPRAVVLDPYTGSRVFLLRWCEWIPLSGYMTLLAEATDLPSNHRRAWNKPILFAACQSASTLCGMIFPFCQSWTQWCAVMLFSWVTFMMIFPRVEGRRQRFQQTPVGRSVLEREYYDRRKFSYYLMLMCSIVWSILVALYTINMLLHMLLPEDHFLRFPSLAMSCDTIADVIAKAVYTKVIVEAYQAVFASDLRTARQLTEVKQLMSTLWVSSSDVIVISTKQTKHRSATVLSPSFLTLVGAHRGAPQSLALVLETDRGKVKTAYYSDTSALPRPEKMSHVLVDLNHNAVQQALRITNATWTTRVSDKNQEEPLRALSIVNCDPQLGKVMCEMKVSRHTEMTAIAVVRDVTERYRRFEAESRVHAETIARQRVMHTANRFTRHEVKNGLLSSIELCRTLGQSLEELKGLLKVGGSTADQEFKERLQEILQQSAGLLSEKTMQSLVDLDGTLHSVLDTVLAEVMAREVVHGVYQPRLEELDVPATLTAGLGMKKDKIHLKVKGGSMPKLMLDAQLIHHIHQNAVSNACKYGKHGGRVETTLEFDAANNEFKLEVTNEPGEGHNTLMALGDSASEFVFAQGVRLQPHMKGDTEKKLDSSGDGAWIMQKCAKTMKGVCRIQFTREQTKLTFQCPVASVASNSQPKFKDFVVPSNVRAIGVDDSKIQRKLLSRILAHAGIDPSRQLLLGENPEDVTEFESTFINLMDEHPTEKFLVIVDEHLDYDNPSTNHHGGIYSGSSIMKDVLDHMANEYKSRCLVLMRSANDSAVDIALYTQRTHGYFPKAIMQKDRTREILAPLWLERFPEDAA